ncbi:uncharacterized protein LOC143083199 [Mytilus galloprovincialis]|uniref:uncharacterized protein LOC143083199 n=1 Tax=Mytilus galloprovincialis TaxID=29158 RepID=UPI003F7C74A5
MASKFPICGSCDSRNISVPSTTWCINCKEGLCEECKVQHLLNKASRSHGIIHILPVSVLQIEESCKLHGENNQAYCHEHECSCCTKSLIEEHKKCKNFTNIHDNNKLSNVNISQQMDDFVDIVKQNIINTEEIDVQTRQIYTALIQRENNEAKYEKLGKTVVQTSSDYMSSMKQKNKKAQYSKLGANDEQIAQAYTSSILRENKEAPYSKLGENDQHIIQDYTSLIPQENKEAQYSKLGENDEHTSSNYIYLMKQKNKEAQYSKLGENDEQITQAYTSLIPQEHNVEAYTELSEIVELTRPVSASSIGPKNTEEASTELGEIVELTSAIHTSSMGQENTEEASSELGEIVELTSAVYTSSMGQENREETYAEIGEIVELTSPVYTSSIEQENREETYTDASSTELGEIVEMTSPVYTSSMEQENGEESYTELGETVGQTDPDLCFIVMAKPGKAAWKFGLISDYRLYVKPEGFTLEDIKKRTLKCHWPYDIVQQYGKSKEGREFVITVGRRHILGPGNVTFLCDSRDNLERLFRLVPIFIQQSAGKP